MLTARRRHRPRCARLALAVGFAAASLAGASAADASSITYAKGDNLWSSTPDGVRQVQLTHGSSYAEPSQADDGTIVAIGSNNSIYRIAQSGRVLSGPVLTWLKYYGGQGFTGPYDAKVSPDGSTVAFTFFHTQPIADGGSGYPELGTSYSRSDRTTAANDIGLIRQFGNPSWIDNTHTAIFAPGVDGFGDSGLQNMAFHELGHADPRATDDMAHAYLWFDDAAASYIQSGELTRAGDKFAAVEGSPAAPERIRIYSVSAAPPSPAVQSAPPVFQCELDHPPAGGYHEVSWSPDGNQLAYQAGDNIYVVDVGPLAGACPQLSPPRLLVAGGTSPDWGPADLSRDAGMGALPAGGGADPRISAISLTRPRLSQALSRGLQVRASLDRAGTLRATATIDMASARRLGLGKLTRVADGLGSLRAAGRRAITLHFTPGAQHALRRARALRLTVRLVAFGAAGRQSSAVLRETLRR